MKFIFLASIQLVQADLIFTEFMVDPEAGSDSVAEWVEIFNSGAGSIDLMGYKIGNSGASSLTINSSVVVGAGDYITIGRSADTSVNGNLTHDYVSNSSILSLHNTNTDLLTLTDSSGTLVDSVGWDSTWAWEKGASMVLSDTSLDNALKSSWQTSTVAMSNGDFGSPGAAAVPEPSSFLLGGLLAFFGFASATRRRSAS